MFPLVYVVGEGHFVSQILAIFQCFYILIYTLIVYQRLHLFFSLFPYCKYTTNKNNTMFFIKPNYRLKSIFTVHVIII